MKPLLMMSIAAVALAFPGQGSAQRVPSRTDSWSWSSLQPSQNGSFSSPLRLGGTLPVRIPWSRADIALASAFTASLLMDAAQTRGLAQGGWQGFHEANPLLGSRPSVGRINAYTAVAGLTVLGAAAALPARVRPWFLCAAFVIEAFTVSGNARAGIPIRL